MVQAHPKQLTFEEYIDVCNQTKKRYELVRGQLVEMTPPTWMHIRIAKFLERLFDAEIERMGHPWEAFRDSGQRTDATSSRLPDVIVAPLDVVQPLMDQTAVLQVAAPLVVEIVSSSSVRDDYTHKLLEYEALGILEYWIVDHEALGASQHIGFPKLPTVSVNCLVDGRYQRHPFKGITPITSFTFPDLKLTAEDVFRGRFSVGK
jgi:Uma2 family endonuclease